MTKKVNDNVVFIGEKPFMNYITAIVIQFTANKSNEVVIKARGKYIARAVDIEESVRNKFLKDLDLVIKEIQIGSDQLKNKQGEDTSVSTM